MDVYKDIGLKFAILNPSTVSKISFTIDSFPPDGKMPDSRDLLQI